ncbi:Hypp859 [Branchiostoma lanceolatum]|uniref:Hypp859 protein n=1 Tax=Branchiostoma lanceolatum TaxID=7740 RepID=A0A8J9W1C7_BRALA|nr:Hypp859 [Branchiostoma lanceolatum]
MLVKKRMLVLLLIVLKEAGPTAAAPAQTCSSSCSSTVCRCSGSDLASIPQDLPTTITTLDLWDTGITTLSQADFTRDLVT